MNVLFVKALNKEAPSESLHIHGIVKMEIRKKYFRIFVIVVVNICVLISEIRRNRNE